MRRVFVCGVIVGWFIVLLMPIAVLADVDSELKDIEAQINQRQHTLDLIQSANSTNKKELAGLEAQVTLMQRQIDAVAAAIGE